jgi:uncharacterized metal-binding protein YceD (DUF177 family)
VSAEKWHITVRLEDIPESGRRFAVEADPAARAALAPVAGVNELERLRADFDVRRHGAGLRVLGRVSGKVRQTCVVTLNPVENEIEEEVDLIFLPDIQPAEFPVSDLGESSDVEPLVNGTINLGSIATEFLLLGIDPYPRQPGATFSAEVRSDKKPEENPFAALAMLKKEQGRH